MKGIVKAVWKYPIATGEASTAAVDLYLVNGTRRRQGTVFVVSSSVGPWVGRPGGGGSGGGARGPPVRVNLIATRLRNQRMLSTASLSLPMDLDQSFTLTENHVVSKYTCM